MRVTLAFTVLFFLVAGCSGSGGFTEGFKLGKKSEDKEEGNGQEEGLGKKKEGDSADQPIQITGTYLTCVEINSSDTHGTFGCRVADKTSGTTINLNDVALQWEFDYELQNATSGAVTTKPVSTLGTYHVFYDFEAATKGELKALVANTRITLNLDLRPGAGMEATGPEFAGLITSFIPQGQSEIVNGTQSALDDGIVTVNPNPAADPQVVQNPGTTSTQPSTQTNNPSTTPAAVPTPNTATDNTEPVTVNPQGPAVNPQPAAVVANGNDPVATFSLVLVSDGVMSLRAAFDQDVGLTDATFSAPTTLGYAGSFPNTDGSSTFMLTTAMTVSVKKGAKTCTGSGTIGAGKISLPLVCK